MPYDDPRQLPTASSLVGPTPEGTAEQVGRGKPYKLLCQCHDDYSAALIEEIDDLYVGGYRIRAKAAKYLDKSSNEHELTYGERCATSSFQGFFAQVVDQFVSEAFGQPLNVSRPLEPKEDAADAPLENPAYAPPPKDDFYAEFERDADLRGHPFVDVEQSILRTALKHKRAIVQVDAPAPAPGEEPMSLIDEERAGLRLYAYELPIESLINWKLDNRGRFEWAVIRTSERVQAGPLDPQGRCRVSFTVWTMEDGFARWERYALEYDERQPPHDDTPIPLEAEGATKFKRVPLVRLELPDGLWVGNKIGPMQREHWQRRSKLVIAENRSLLAVPVVQLAGPLGQGGAIPSELAQDAGRGDDPKKQFEKRGYMALDANDKYGFMEPEGKGFELTDKQLEKLRETMLQVNHQMALSVSPTPGTSQRSGLSKQKDNESTAKVLRALGHYVRLHAVMVYEVLSEALGDDANWVAHGLDTYEDDDRSLILEEAVGMGSVAIPSPTFKKEYSRLLARKLLGPNAEPHVLQQIDDEIKRGVGEEMEHQALEKEAEQASLEAQRDVANHPQSHKPAPPKPAKPAGPPGSKG